MSSDAARARRRPSSSSGCGSWAKMPLGRRPGSARPRRDAWRTTSWFDRTHVVGAPTSSFACSDAAITVRSGAASQPVVRNEKLNAWCISSGRT
ncbi:Uncharacterised protein [Mycobacteroides abscessus]|nr:Uncharacterised protein [Mycobacteroides abscessus]